MTFWQFLKKRAKVPGALGDFARDATADPTFPRGRAVTYLAVMGNLEQHNASDDAVWAFMRDWGDWQALREPADTHAANAFTRLDRANQEQE